MNSEAILEQIKDVEIKEGIIEESITPGWLFPVHVTDREDVRPWEFFFSNLHPLRLGNSLYVHTVIYYALYQRMLLEFDSEQSIAEFCALHQTNCYILSVQEDIASVYKFFRSEFDQVVFIGYDGNFFPVSSDAPVPDFVRDADNSFIEDLTQYKDLQDYFHTYRKELQEYSAKVDGEKREIGIKKKEVLTINLIELKQENILLPEILQCAVLPKNFPVVCEFKYATYPAIHVTRGDNIDRAAMQSFTLNSFSEGLQFTEEQFTKITQVTIFLPLPVLQNGIVLVHIPFQNAIVHEVDLRERITTKADGNIWLMNHFEHFYTVERLLVNLTCSKSCRLPQTLLNFPLKFQQLPPFIFIWKFNSFQEQCNFISSVYPTFTGEIEKAVFVNEQEKISFVHERLEMMINEFYNVFWMPLGDQLKHDSGQIFQVTGSGVKEQQINFYSDETPSVMRDFILGVYRNALLDQQQHYYSYNIYPRESQRATRRTTILDIDTCLKRLKDQFADADKKFKEFVTSELKNTFHAHERQKQIFLKHIIPLIAAEVRKGNEPRRAARQIACFVFPQFVHYLIDYEAIMKYGVVKYCDLIMELLALENCVYNYSAQIKVFEQTIDFDASFALEESYFAVVGNILRYLKVWSAEKEIGAELYTDEYLGDLVAEGAGYFTQVFSQFTERANDLLQNVSSLQTNINTSEQLQMFHYGNDLEKQEFEKVKLLERCSRVLRFGGSIARADIELLRNGDSIAPFAAGGNGKIFHARYKNKDVVIKTNVFNERLSNIEQRPSIVTSMFDELTILEKLSLHPGIVKLHGWCFDRETGSSDGDERYNFWMVFEKCVPIVDYWKDSATAERSPSDRLRKFGKHLEQLVDALAFIHQNFIIHRDIKADNILLSGDNLVVADVGVSTLIAESNETHVGTPGYMAPEIARNEQYGHKVDVFGFGVLLWELWVQRKFNFRQNRQMCSGFWDQAIEMKRKNHEVNHHDEHVQNLLKPIFTECLADDPTSRPTFIHLKDKLKCVFDYIETHIGNQ